MPKNRRSDDAEDLDDDIDEPDDDDDEDDDPDEGKSDEELRAELKATRDKLTRANGSASRHRKARRAAEEAATKPKPKAEDDDKPDLDAVRAEGRREGLDRAKRSEARAALAEAGVSRERLGRAVGLLKLDDLDLDEEGLDGIDDEIARLRDEWPEVFGKRRRQRDSSLGGERDRDGAGASRESTMTIGEKQAAILTGRMPAGRRR